MSGRVLMRHAAPLATLLVVAGADLLAGRDQVVFGLLAIVPVLAATVLDQRGTLAYGVAALLLAALLGAYDEQYTASAAFPQAVRLAGVAFGGAVALISGRQRLRREAELGAQEHDRAKDLAVQQLAETFQRSLLVDPPELDGLEVSAHYLPAGVHAKVGGDWYDAFPRPDGTVMAVIGDVAGHDGSAAAAMAHVRNLLRGIAQTDPRSPAILLGNLDRTLRGLSVRTLATLVVVTMVRGSDGALVCWSNTGHPPPLLIPRDGPAALLHTTPEPLIGVVPQADRSDHEVHLGPGDTLLLYTDGLVERHGADIDDGLDALRAAADVLGRAPLAELTERLLGAVPGGRPDDIALLALRPTT